MAKRGRPPSSGLLTPREQEVLHLIRDGLTNSQIGDRLNISVETVKQHVSEILSKLGVESREEAAAWRPGDPRGWHRLLAPLTVAKAALLGAALVVMVALGLLALAVLNTDEQEHSTDEVPNEAQGPEGLPGGIYRMGTDGSAVEPVAVPEDPADAAHFGYSTFSLSPDGRWLAYSPRAPFNTAVQDPDAKQALYLRDLAPGGELTEVARFGHIWSVSTSPDGRIVVGGSIDTPADPSLIDEDFYLVDAAGAISSLPWFRSSWAVAWSPAGDMLAAAGSAGGGKLLLTIVAVNGTVVRKIELPSGNIAWSPDGSRIAIGAFTGGEVGLLVLDVADGAVTKLNDLQADMLSRVSWSPDGTRIAFAVQNEIFTSEMESNSVAKHFAEGSDPAWSRDGEQIAYTRQGILYASDSQGDGERQVASLQQPLVSGHQWLSGDTGILFHYAPWFLSSIRVANPDGSGEVHLAYGDDPVWSPDGSMIAFIGRVESYGFTGASEVYVMEANGSNIRKIGDFYSVSDVIDCRSPGLAWYPDSSRVVYFHPGEGALISAPADGHGDPEEFLGGCPTAERRRDRSSIPQGVTGQPPHPLPAPGALTSPNH